MILFLGSCTRTVYSHPKVSPQYLENCPIPQRLGSKNKHLLQYTMDLYESLGRCNADKEALRKELNQ